MISLNKVQKQFIKILDASIHRCSIENICLEKAEWESLIEEAEAHKVSGLIYRGCRTNQIPDEVLSKWKKSVIMESFQQSEKVKKIASILELCNQSKIEVIVLKGIVLRNLYPAADLRTMNDLDILVHEHQLKEVEDLLINQGYYKYTEDGEKHDVYIKSGWPMIEVHWMLSHERTFKGCVEYEKSLWNRVREVEIQGVKTLTLGYNDFLLHLMIHMASHAASRGFGVRFLTDIVLMIEKESEKIDWDQFKLDLKQCEIERFSAIMLKCCEDLFDFKIPEALSDLDYSNLKYLGQLQVEILESGVHGLREKGAVIAKEMAYDRETSSIFKRFMKFIFPPIHSMSEKYNYAKRNQIFVPVAWIHHLFAGLFNKEYKLVEKLKIFFCGIHLTKKRSQLIRWLELE